MEPKELLEIERLFESQQEQSIDLGFTLLFGMKVKPPQAFKVYLKTPLKLMDTDIINEPAKAYFMHNPFCNTFEFSIHWEGFSLEDTRLMLNMKLESNWAINGLHAAWRLYYKINPKKKKKPHRQKKKKKRG